MPPPSYMNLTTEDLKDENLSKINKMFRELVEEVSRLGGVNGTISVGGDLDLQGKFKVINPAT